MTDVWHDAQFGPALADHLVFLRSVEGLSFGLIANRLGVSRSTAIGKARRLNLPPPQQKVTLVDVRGLAPTAAKHRRKRSRVRTGPTPLLIPPRDQHNHYTSIWRLDNCSCRYPMWRSDVPVSDRLYCGVPHADLSKGRPYCAKHAALCFNATPPMKPVKL